MQWKWPLKVLCLAFFLTMSGIAAAANEASTATYSNLRLAPAMPAPLLPAHGWLTLETPHFLVHYPPGVESAAREIAWAGEEAHRALVPKLEYLPEEKTHIVVADISDTANGLTRVVPYNYIMVYPVFPDNLAWDSGISPRTRDWYKQLLMHEYAHVLHLDMNFGSSTQLRRLLGKVPWVTTPNSMQGMAVLEGYATLEEASSGSGRGTDTFYDMFLRSAVLVNQLPGWDQILGDYQLTGWQPGPPMYLFGFAFLDYISRTYGPEKLPQIHRRHAEAPLSGINSAFEHVLGVKFPELWQDWRDDLTTRYNQQLAGLGVTTAPQLLETVGWAALWPRWQPDGQAILYGSASGVVPSLRLIKLQGAPGEPSKNDQNDQLLLNGVIDRSNGYVWLPDGSGVIYGKIDYLNGRMQSDLYLFKLKTREEQRLTKGYRAYAPTLSPNGKWVAFLGRREDVSRILVASLTERTPLVLWAPNEVAAQPDLPDQVLSLAWSPQGDALVFAARDYNGQIDLFQLPLALTDENSEPRINGRLLRLTNDTAVDIDPAWSADGHYLFYASDNDGVYNIWVRDMQNGNLYKATNVAGGALAPAPSPDGRTLAFSSYSAKGYSLAIIPLQPDSWQLPNPMATSTTTAPIVAVEPELVPEPVAVQPLAIRLDSPPLRQLAPAEGELAKLGQKRPAWEKDLSRAIDPRDFIVRPYSAAESLTPRYWLPNWGGPGGNWVTGGSTSAVDALGRHEYALQVLLGSEEASFDLGYEYRPGPLGAGPALGIALAGSRTALSTPAASFAKSISPLAQSFSATLPFPLLGDQNIEPEAQQWQFGNSSTAGDVYIRWSQPGIWSESQSIVQWQETAGSQRSRGLLASTWWQTYGGNGSVHRSSQFGLQGLHTLTFTPVDTALVAAWEGKQAVPGQYQLSAGLAVGLSKQPNRYVLSGDSVSWQVRGLPSKYAAGQFVARTTLEAQWLGSNIQRGMGDYPVFVDNLSWAVFLDGAATANLGEPSKTALTAGLELRLTSTMGFGLSRDDVRVGAACSVDGSTPCRIYAGFGSGF